MAEINNVAFEVERRFIQLKYNTNMPDGISILGYDGNPNSVVNGDSEGQTLIYYVALGASFLQSNGNIWFKTGLPNTWIQLGSSTTVASSVVTYTIPPGVTQEFYSLALANNKNFEWVVSTTHAGEDSLSKLSSLYTNAEITSNEYSFLGHSIEMDINISVSGTDCVFEITNNETAGDILASVKVECFNAL